MSYPPDPSCLHGLDEKGKSPLVLFALVQTWFFQSDIPKPIILSTEPREMDVESIE